MSPVVLQGTRIGWGATCKRHHNLCDAKGTQCKKQLPYGKLLPLTDTQCVTLLKQWLLEGFQICTTDSDCRSDHVKVDPRSFDIDASAGELDGRLEELTATQ